MATVAWHALSTRTRVKAMVRDFESRTSAELVVTVRPSSADYAGASHLFAALVALAGLAVYLYADAEFTDDLVAPGLVLLYASAVWFGSRIRWLQRMLTSRARLDANVQAAAKAAFVDQGIAVTRERTGVLLYVSALEGRAAIVADVGVLRRDAEGKVARAFEVVTSAIAAGRSLDDLETALRAASAELAHCCPRRSDDENELPDDVEVR